MFCVAGEDAWAGLYRLRLTRTNQSLAVLSDWRKQQTSRLKDKMCISDRCHVTIVYYIKICFLVIKTRLLNYILTLSIWFFYRLKVIKILWEVIINSRHSMCHGTYLSQMMLSMQFLIKRYTQVFLTPGLIMSNSDICRAYCQLRGINVWNFFKYMLHLLPLRNGNKKWYPFLFLLYYNYIHNPTPMFAIPKINLYYVLFFLFQVRVQN